MPKPKSRNELKAGIFVVAMLAVLVLVVIWLGASDWFTPTESQAFFVSDVKDGARGLVAGSDVYLGDIKIGKIQDITVSDDGKRILYHVVIQQKDISIYADGKGKATSPVMGSASLLITSLGEKSSGPATEKNPIPLTGGFQEIADNLGVVSQQLRAQMNLKNKASLLSKVQVIADKLMLTSIDIAKIIERLKPEMNPDQKDTIVANLKVTMKNLAETSTTINQYAKKDVKDIILKVRKIADSVLETANNIQAVSSNAKLFMDVHRNNIDDMIDNMVLMTANLKATSAEVRRNPWRLLYRPDDKQLNTTNLYDAARAFDEGATQLDLAVNKLKALLLLKKDNPEAAKEYESVRKQLMESFKKFKEVEDTLWKEVSKQK